MKAAPLYRGDDTSFARAIVLWCEQEGSAVHVDNTHSLWSNALNAASSAAYRRGGPEAISAALCHDFGRLILRAQGAVGASISTRGATRVGVDWLAGFFTAPVVEAVRHLNDARRWLLSFEKSYRYALDVDALRNIAEAGGPMSEAERVTFERRTYWRDAANLARDIATSADQPCTQDSLVTALTQSLRKTDMRDTQKVA